MNPTFFHDYVPAIAKETEWVATGSGCVPRHKIQATDADGNSMLGAFSWANFGEAYWRLRDFIDGELERRGCLSHDEKAVACPQN